MSDARHEMSDVEFLTADLKVHQKANKFSKEDIFMFDVQYDMLDFLRLIFYAGYLIEI